MAVLGQNHPLMGNFKNSSIKVQYTTPIDVFGPNLMPICPVTKKSEFIVKIQFFAAILRPFGPGQQNFNA